MPDVGLTDPSLSRYLAVRPLQHRRERLHFDRSPRVPGTRLDVALVRPDQRVLERPDHLLLRRTGAPSGRATAAVADRGAADEREDRFPPAPRRLCRCGMTMLQLRLGRSCWRFVDAATPIGKAPRSPRDDRCLRRENQIDSGKRQLAAAARSLDRPDGLRRARLVAVWYGGCRPSHAEKIEKCPDTARCASQPE